MQRGVIIDGNFNDYFFAIALVVLTIGTILLGAYYIYKAICYVISEKHDIDT